MQTAAAASTTAAPVTASRPDPHRSSEYGNSSMKIMLFGWGTPPPVSTEATAEAPKAIVTAASGLARRHSRVGTRASASNTDQVRHGRSARSNPSVSAATASAAASGQSRRPGVDGRAGRGSSHSGRTRSRTPPR